MTFLKKYILLLLLSLQLASGHAQNIDSLMLLYKNLPESRKNDLEDTTACYLLYAMVQTYTDINYTGKFSIPLNEIAGKRLAKLPADHRLVKVYKNYRAVALNDIAACYREKGDVIKALEYLHESLKLYEELHSLYETGEVYNNIATVYYDIGAKDKALVCYKKSYELLNKVAGKTEVIQALTNIAYLYFDRKNFDSSLYYYDISLRAAEAIDNKFFISECINGIGLNYSEQGFQDKALALFKQSLKIREEIGDDRGITTTLNNIGTSYSVQKKYHEALKYSERSLKMSRQINSFERIRQAAFALKTIYENLGNYKQALEMEELYIQMRDSTNNRANRKAALEKQLEHEYDKKKIILNEEQEKFVKLYEQKQRFYVILGVVLFILLIIFFYSLYFRYRFRQEKASKNLHIELKERLKQEIKEKERIANSIIHIQEQEREKLAAELHDGVNQLLFAGKIQLQAATSVDDEMHKEAIKMIDTAINEIKSIASNQGSFLLGNKLLKDALTDLFLQMKSNKNISISFSDYGFEEGMLDIDQKINILRIIQELLNNAIKHSSAKKFYIAIKTKGNKVIFSVTDTGSGISHHNAGKGNGLNNISNKVLLMNGVKRISSLLNKGSKIYIEIPLS